MKKTWPIARKGKVARLPEAVREAVNRRLADGACGSRLVAWLNSLPEVRAVLAAEFHGQPLSEQNLSQWRRGGYRDWQAQRAAGELAAGLGAGRPVPFAPEGLTEPLAAWLVTRFAVAAQKLAASRDGALELRELRELCHAVVALRRGDHRAERLRLEATRLALKRADRRHQPGKAGGKLQFARQAFRKV